MLKAPRARRRPLAGLALCLLVTTSGVSARETAVEDAALSANHRAFLDMTEPLLHETERRVFLELDQNYRRDVFIQRFWRMRDPYPQTPRNELRERLDENFLTLREQIVDASADQAIVLLLHGEPTRRFRDTCQLLVPINVWHYRSSGMVAREFSAVFYRERNEWTLWQQSDGVERLLQRAGAFTDDATLARVQQECSRGEELVGALGKSLDWERLNSRVLGDHDPEWALALLESSAQVSGDGDVKPIVATSHFAGRRQSRVVVQTMLRLDHDSKKTDPAAATATASGTAGSTEAASSSEAASNAEPATRRLLVDGEIIRSDTLFDSFRYRFEQQLGGKAEELMIERYLRPGNYRLVLEVTAPGTDERWVLDDPLVVPPLSELDANPDIATATIESPELVASEPEQAGGELAPTLRLSVPNRELLIGAFRAEAFTEGTSIRRVAFELNGERVLSKARPPYSVELDAGRVPRTHQLAAIAFDENGDEVARDEVTVNAGPRRFSTRLIEPRRGARYEAQVRAVAEVDVPPLEKLDSVEFFLNDQRVATLYQQPFALPIRIPEDEPLAFVRVIAKLTNGQQTEDLVFVNSEHEVDYVDVDLVEVFATVTNRRGLPIEELAMDQFQVFEDGVAQRIDEFRRVRDLPINACVLFDTSTSMMERMKEAREAADYFFQLVLREQDRACLMTFNDVHELVVDFTHSPEVLAGGLADVTTEGETALYDSLIHTLYLFNGLRGKRAIILLSDGADSKSDYRFSEALEFARRSEVTIHVIGVDIQSRDQIVRMRLSQLAKETGGRAFFIDTISELRRVYDLVEKDLRSQYLLAYQSQSTKPRDEFRKIKVEMKQRGMRARTLSGYYP